MDILYIIVIVLVVAWLGGFSLKFGGKLIHLLLVLAVIIFLFRVLT
ncbi:MAG: lmo0937 family membrane protein [Candidatus Dojkabacteria bacterium]|nr:lmo0937 family membrane protein [Candidatus Dojkabacteria bacterium]MDD2270487.1 lmo0937 family membrane protein [Candidatus Dojkabacteria bacterium]